MVSLTKTSITQLNNSYIDCSYTNKATTEVVNIELPNPTGDLVRLPFTIRTKDGFNLKYDKNTGNVVFRIDKKFIETGNVVFRIDKKFIEFETTGPTIIANYDDYFKDHTFNLKSLSTFVNNDPVFDYKPPTYRVKGPKDSHQNIPLFEYSDIEEQKENIYIIDIGMIDQNSKPVYIASYYGNNPKKCKLDLVSEKFSYDGEDPSYNIKTTQGRFFYINNSVGQFGTDEIGWGGTLISSIVSINLNAEKVGEVNSKPVYIASYYGNNPKKCKLDLISEKFSHDGEEPSYNIKTTKGRFFYINNSVGLFGTDETGWGGTLISSVVSINLNAEKVGEVIEEDTTDGLFTTYVVNQNDLKKIADTGKIYSGIIINTFSYPIKFEYQLKC